MILSHAGSVRGPGLTSLENVFLSSLTAPRSRQDVVSNAEVTDPTGNAQAEFQIRVDSEGIAQAAEGLLRLISELRIAAVVQDVASTSKEADETRRAFDLQIENATTQLETLRDTVSDLLSRLEDHYYSSTCAVPQVPSATGTEVEGERARDSDPTPSVSAVADAQVTLDAADVQDSAMVIE